MNPLVWLAAALGLIVLVLFLFADLNAGSRADDLAERHEVTPDARFYITNCGIQRLTPEQLRGLRAEYERRVRTEKIRRRKTADPEHAHVVDLLAARRERLADATTPPEAHD
jgi:hypothetical protein